MGPKVTYCLALLFAVIVARPVSSQIGTVITTGSCSGTGGSQYRAGEAISFELHRPVQGASALPGFPPCSLVQWTVDATGKPPLTVTWEVDPPSGQQLSGNPATLDTTGLAFGEHTMTCTVSNSFPPPASCPLTSFTIDHAAWVGPPGYQNVSGTTIQFMATTVGATEWNWDFGDGTTSGWLSGCEGVEPVHTYAVAGSYTVGAQARNCLDAAVTSSQINVEAGEVEITQFAAQGCAFGFCIFLRNEEITFSQSFNGDPETFSYDWEGDGIVDEEDTQPILTHTYTQVGTYQPTLTVRRGTLEDTRVHSPSIVIQDQLPDAPSGLSATIVGRSVSSSSAVGVEPGGAVEAAVVTATWVDNSDNENGFLLERKRDSDPFEVFAQTGPDATALEKFTLPAGHVWQLQLKAFNSAGNSSASNTVTLDLTNF